MRAASAAIAFEPAGEQVLKGKAAPVPAWRAMRVVADARRRGPQRGARAAVRRPRRRAAAAQGAAPRDRARAAGAAGVGHRAGRASARAAWPGSSRSTSTASSRTIYWHQGRSPAYGEGITFWALGEMVRGAGRAGRDRRRGDDARADRRDGRGVRPRRGGAALDRAARCLRCSASRRPRRRARELFAAWRTFFERIADRARRSSSSRTSNGPTRACSTSSTTCSSGAAAIRSSS